MIYIDISQNGTSIILDCHKGTKDGEYFQIVIDTQTREVIKKPDYPDIDVTTAYSHIYALLREGKPLPEHTVAAWG